MKALQFFETLWTKSPRLSLLVGWVLRRFKDRRPHLRGPGSISGQQSGGFVVDKLAAGQASRIVLAFSAAGIISPIWHAHLHINPLALELDIYSLAHHLYKMWIFYEPRRVTLGNTRHFVEEWTKMVRESLIYIYIYIYIYICWLNI